MATITVQAVDRDGIDLTESAATVTTGDEFVAADDQRHFVVINNGSTGQISATIMAQTLSAHQDGAGVLSVADIVHPVAAGKIAIVPVLPDFIRANDGIVKVTCDSVTGVTIAAVKLPRLD
jgi:hypothetical protein